MLHRRATEWFEQHGERPEAIRHALAGGDQARAADLIELAIPAAAQARQEATVRRWLEALSDDVIRTRPVLSDGYAASLLVRGETEGVESRLRDAERWLQHGLEDGEQEPGTQPAKVVADEHAFRALPGQIAIHRAGLARLLGDVPDTILHARHAIELVREDDDVRRGAAVALLGLAFWTSGDLDAAYRQYEEAIDRFERSGHLSDVVGCGISIADIRITQGRLSDAMEIYRRGLEVATRAGGAPLRGAADMHVGMSELLRERNDLAAAHEHLRMSRELGEENGLPQNPYRSRVAEARLRQAEGDLRAAAELLVEAERVYNTDFAPKVRPVPAWQARLAIAQGNLSAARAWARRVDVSASDDLSYEHEFEHLTLARLLVAQGREPNAGEHLANALGLLDRLLVATTNGERTGTVIDVLVVRAVALHAAGGAGEALAALDRAVRLAEPEGYVRTILDEGAPMVALLRLAARERAASAHVRRLLAASGTSAGPPAAGSPAAAQGLIEPLSERELEVLRLLGSDLDGPGIARELVVSLNTVRTHTKNVYAKLGVNSRRAAVTRAAELGLLARGRDPGVATP